MQEEIVEEYNVTTNEIMSYLKTTMVTKEEFGELKNKVDKMDERLENVETRLGRVEKAVDTN